MRRTIAVHVVMMFVCGQAVCQENASDTSSGFLSRDLTAFWHDAGYMLSAPGDFSRLA